jgi:four helix bundle protein
VFAGVVVYRYQELIAWQMAEAFKTEVFTLVRESPAASADFRFRGQLFGAAQSVSANIAEGFLRNSPGDFRRFLSIALGSLGEAETRLRDGIQLNYFVEAKCEPAFRFARRAATAAVRLRKSQLAFMPPRT